MHQKDSDGMTNSVDPDQKIPLGAVQSGITMLAQLCLSNFMVISFLMKTLRPHIKIIT